MHDNLCTRKFTVCVYRPYSVEPYESPRRGCSMRKSIRENSQLHRAHGVIHALFRENRFAELTFGVRIRYRFNSILINRMRQLYNFKRYLNCTLSIKHTAQLYITF